MTKWTSWNKNKRNAAAKQHIDAKEGEKKGRTQIFTSNLLRQIFTEYSAIRLAYSPIIWYSVNGQIDYSLLLIIKEAVCTPARMNMYRIPNILKDIHINFQLHFCLRWAINNYLSPRGWKRIFYKVWHFLQQWRSSRFLKYLCQLCS